MADLVDALEALERALYDARHPLADPLVRPPGRDGSETRSLALELLGIDLPTELTELWSWWGGEPFPASGTKLGPFEKTLPGGVRIATLEESVETFNHQHHSEVLPRGCERALPAMLYGDDVVIFWCSTLPSRSNRTRITVVDIEDVDEPICELDSVASVVEDMVRLLDERMWVTTPELGWHYVGDYGVFDWLT